MGQSLKYRFLFFGSSRELINPDVIPQDWPEGTTVGDIRNKLDSLAPGMDLLHYAIAINQVYALDDQAVPDRAEIAVLPPVSGG